MHKPIQSQATNGLQELENLFWKKKIRKTD